MNPPGDLYGDLAWPEVTEQLSMRSLVVPVGAIEQHGPHLPLTVDLDLANAFARDLTARLGGLLAPPLVYGARSLPQSGGGSSFAGTVSARGSTLISYFDEILTSYVRAGARDIVVVNGHYENEPFLFEAMEMCREGGAFDDVRMVSTSWWSVVAKDELAAIFEDDFPGWHAEHAGLCETSLMLHLRPETVRPERPRHEQPPRAGVYISPIDPDAISDRGVLASTARSSVDAGKALYDHVCNELEALVRAPHGLAKW